MTVATTQRIVPAVSGTAPATARQAIARILRTVRGTAATGSPWHSSSGSAII